jgi:ABC-type spermidine/putrescine transport system permease subunit II
MPLMVPGLAVGLLVVMVLSAADVSTTLLLQPPGRQSLPVAIFTIMANSPEGLVASVCLTYVLGVVVLMSCGVGFYRWRTKDD